MKKHRSSQFLAICTAAVLALSVPAWASQVSITPLDTGNTTSSQSQSGASEPSTAQNTSGQTVDISSITKPTVASQGAVLLNAADGSVLFSKNGDTTYYPASITKLMTALLVAENCNLDDTVTFSATATTNLESGAVSIGMAEGDTMTVRQCLYALLLKICPMKLGKCPWRNMWLAVMQHLRRKMNAKSTPLRLHTQLPNLPNPHGLNDPNHYTTPHDMALIARAAFCKMIL